MKYLLLGKLFHNFAAKKKKNGLGDVEYLCFGDQITFIVLLDLINVDASWAPEYK